MNASIRQKRKKTSKASTSDFAAAINKILSSSVKPADRNIPILSRSKGIERRIDDAKLEYRARKAINIEKKKLADKDRIKEDFTAIETERRLRKIATRGGMTNASSYYDCYFKFLS
ncbi:Rrp15p-domain-containing protein [Gigaspora margarita]|uniref:Rrp15p-domain-containing protein n=1 Tax=Gigaspora margarita TaxID=4874 RepID=A0A8H3WTR2_GIGMA|nr:Rrp15p-domain-containing protein [Gigaspora margarita]